LYIYILSLKNVESYGHLVILNIFEDSVSFYGFRRFQRYSADMPQIKGS